MLPARKTKKKKLRPTGAKAARKQRSALAQGTTFVPKCTRDYMRVLSDPIGSYGEVAEACVPDAVVLPSTKRSYRLRGAFSTGTSGVGFILLSPYRPATDHVCITTTSAASVGAFNTALTSFNNLDNKNYNVEWSSGDNVHYRIVGAGVKVFYRGTLLNSGGFYGTYRNPVNSDVSLWSLDYMSQTPEWRQFKATADGSAEEIWLPQIDTDFTYDVVSGSNAAPICIGVVSGTTTPQPYEYEVVLYYELNGQYLTQGRTPSHSDPVGFGAVQAGIQEPGMLLQKKGNARHRDLLDRVGDALNNVTRIGGLIKKGWDIGSSLLDVAGGMSKMPFIPLL